MPRPSKRSLEESLGYGFSELGLLEEALTHTSFANEQPGPTPDNERLEFLGDAILDLIISEHLLAAFPEAKEGTLSKLRAQMVNETALAEQARRLDLGEHLRLGRGEELTGGREKPSLLAGAYEALVASVYLDGGYERARSVFLGHFLEAFEAAAASAPTTDFKSLLQERCQRKGLGLPSYRLVGERGPDHDKVFDVEVAVQEGPKGRGTGRSKKEAEQAAARKALERMAQR